MRWQSPPDPLRLAPGEVHVWRVPLDRGPDAVSRARSLLSAEERRRADRFRFPALRDRFIVAHAALRSVLGRTLGAPPGALRLGTDALGKPVLLPVGPETPAFNLAHSAGVALVAVARGRAVGVDVERMRRDLPLARLAARFLAPGEAAELAALPDPVRSAAFFACWTRKEAYLKAAGVGGGRGLAASLPLFVVSVRPAVRRVALAVPGRPAEAARWSLVDLDVGPGFAAALAVEGRARPLTFHWSV